MPDRHTPKTMLMKTTTNVYVLSSKFSKVKTVKVFKIGRIVNMIIKPKVLNKIAIESRKYPQDEFGGYLLVKRNVIRDIFFDIEENSETYVKLGVNSILSIPSRKRKYIRGWFHRHPIQGFSGLDMYTVQKLTTYWGECYTLILQGDNKLLLTKHIKNDKKPEKFIEKIFYNPIKEVYREELGWINTGTNQQSST